MPNQADLKEFCKNSSVHGLAFIVDDDSSLARRIGWIFIFLVSISYAGVQLKGSIDGMLIINLEKHFTIQLRAKQTAHLLNTHYEN